MESENLSELCIFAFALSILILFLIVIIVMISVELRDMMRIPLDGEGFENQIIIAIIESNQLSGQVINIE